VSSESSTGAGPAPDAAAAPIRSMTGYALVRAATSAGELTVTLRSVNHRGLDLHFHPNGPLAQFENAMRSLLKQHLARGHIEIRLSLAPDVEAETVTYNRGLLKRYVVLFREACTEFEIESKPNLNTFFALPGVFDAAHQTKTVDATFESEVIAALAACVHELNAFREREGRELCCAVESEIAAIEEQTAQMGLIRAQALPHFRQRLGERLSDLLHDSGVSESRLAEEAALLADRSDIQEELARLTVHAEEARRLLRSGGEIGKRLDFLLQEMNRETNTVLAKTSGIGEAGLTITNLGLATKANIERIREQALNLE
jgi:uncharacterized protein (TIGR00255 family)